MKKIVFTALIAFLGFNLQAQEATPTTAPEIKAAPNGVTAQTVYKEYIKAIGGEKKLKSIETAAIQGTVTIPGAPMIISTEMKIKVPNKEYMAMTAEGMGLLNKQVFDGEKGYVEQQGMKVDLTEEQIAPKKGKHTLFQELYAKSDEIALEGIVTEGDKELYKIKVLDEATKSYRFYNTKTHLLEKVEVEGGTANSIIAYSDYKEIDGILFPFKQDMVSGMQSINITFTSVVFNEGVTDEDFN